MTNLGAFTRQILACVLLATWTVAAAGAGEPYLVADVGQTPRGSDPDSFVELDGRIYFSAYYPGSGRELWASDGTEEGTRMVADIVPGEGSSNPSQLTVFGDRLMFAARTDASGSELWTSDGTAEGTVLLRDIFPGPEDSFLDELVVFDGRLWFRARDGAGFELWTSDGTPQGTRLYKDLSPGGSSDPQGLTVSGEHLFFHAGIREYGREIWVSDGTPEGTLMLADTVPGPLSGLSDITTIVGRDGTAYFDAIGQKMWFTDGTPEGTEKVDLTAYGLPRARPFAIAGDRLLFDSGTPNFHLWALQGGVAVPLGDDLVYGQRLSFDPPPLTVGDEVFLKLTDSAHGQEIWRSDGTPEGTRLFLDFATGEASSNPRLFAFEGGKLWFRASGDGMYGLMISDGTREGTVQLKASGFEELSFQNGRMWFRGDDDAHGKELWTSDGTREGTRLVRDIDDIRTGSFYVSHLEPISGERLLAFGRAGVWVTDGSSSGTFRVPGSESLELGADTPKLTHLGERVYFEAATPATGNEIWWSDGDAVGLLADLTPGEAGTPLLALGTAGRRLVFAAGSKARVEIWSSDGDGGTVERLAEQVYSDFFDIPLPEIEPVAEIRRLGDSALVFAGWYQRLVGPEEVLWTTDGTAAGTRRTARLKRDSFTPAAELGSHVYFVARGEQITLWKSDGTARGTAAVTALPPDVDRVYRFRSVGDHLWIATSLNPTGRQLWISDGTAAGTAPLPLPATEQFTDAVAAGGRLWVSTYYAPWHDGVSRLWQVDADSLTVKQSLHFAGGMRIASFGGVLYYWLYDDSTSGELWRTDGTPEGTVRLGPPASTSRPQPAVLGNRLVFEGDHPVYGTELYAVDHDCLASSETLCLAGDRFQARSLWRDRSGRSSPGRAGALGAAGGHFWFFDPANPELAVKVLDGRARNGHFWAFSGAVTDLEVDLHLFDVVTGAESHHLHPAGDLSSVADILAFDDSPAPRSRRVTATSGPERVSISTRQTAPGSCQADATTLCLLDGRFALTLARRDGMGSPVPGFARSISDRAGELSYFRRGSPELIAKVHDGRPFNGHFWVFAGSLTDLAYELTVTDTVTGTRRVYSNPPGRTGGFADIVAFDGSPRP